MVRYELDYLKVREEVDKEGGQYFRLWFPDRIDTVYLPKDSEPRLIDTALTRLAKYQQLFYTILNHTRGELVNQI